LESAISRTEPAIKRGAFAGVGDGGADDEESGAPPWMLL
jgi:hypothetical protein